MRLPFKIGISPLLKIRGVIADKDIKKNTIIERCPVVLNTIEKRKPLEETILSEYYFDYTNKFDAIVFGYGSLLNHSFKPNCEIYYDYKNKNCIIKTIKNIKKGEELTHKYMNKKELKLYSEYKI